RSETVLRYSAFVRRRSGVSSMSLMPPLQLEAGPPVVVPVLPEPIVPVLSVPVVPVLTGPVVPVVVPDPVLPALPDSVEAGCASVGGSPIWPVQPSVSARHAGAHVQCGDQGALRLVLIDMCRCPPRSRTWVTLVSCPSRPEGE